MQLGGPDGDEARRAARVKEPLDTANLERWIIARKGDVAAADHDIRHHVAWRESHVPGGRYHKKDCAKELAAEKVFIGAIKSGHSLITLLVRLHDANKRDIEETKRFIIYTLDLGRAMCNPQLQPHRKLVGVIDLTGLAFKNLDSSALLQVFKILQNHYPEALEKLFMVNAPAIFSGVWRVVSPFVDPVTKSKIQFCTDKELASYLETIADKHEIPKIYGGDADLVLVQDAADKVYGMESEDSSSSVVYSPIDTGPELPPEVDGNPLEGVQGAEGEGDGEGEAKP